ncbi:MAG TPA: acyl-CoA desaturase [Chitinophagaceae bacterium]|nr:acyl-CoA desaturase [Chitinophagaceae bacterium]
MLIILLAVLCHWYFSLFTQSFLHHRYASHRAFSMNKFWERFFYMFAYLAQGSSYVSPKVYAIMHRMHHAYTDTDKDPHSPSYDKNMFVMMWNTRALTTDIYKGNFVPEDRFLKNLPDWSALDRWAHSWMSRVMWILIYITFYILFAPSAWWFLLIPFHILTVPFHGVIINWFAHKYGSIQFKLKNTSRNLFPVDILMLGEGYHNNHHKTPSAANFGKRWFELDPIYPIILFLNRLKIIRISKIPLAQRTHEEF